MKSVIDMIEKLKSEAPFDIVPYVCPDDDAGYMLEDLRDHFNTLHAVARTIAPERIIGFNTGYGYGAAALLHGAPGASYEGVGVSEHAAAWTRQLISAYPKVSLTAEGRPAVNGTWDLMEISGVCDGDYLFTTLERYACRSRWFAVSINLMAVNDSIAFSFWLIKYHKLVKYAHLIPTRQGLWLVEMHNVPGQASTTGNLNYKDVEQFYTGEYFLTDCGGYPQFRKFKGKELAEPRLVVIYNMVSPEPGMQILDVGCGRGELAFALAKSGATVHAIDYSADAANLAKSTYGDLEICRSGRLTFEQQDLFAAEFAGQFDVIIAADFIEHIDSALEEVAIKKLRDSLKPGGRLIIHTAPNLLNYRYAYKRRRKLAGEAGAYLPPNPRTFYEQMVHINEQTPARLNRLMRRTFPAVLTWVASDPDPRGSLMDKRRNGILIHGLSIFSIASDASVTRQEILDRLYPQQAGMNVEPAASIAGSSKVLLKQIWGRMATYLAGFITGEQRNKNR